MGFDNCTMDLSMFKVGDKVKMVVQSVAAAGKQAKRPLLRGIPDFRKHPECKKDVPASQKPNNKYRLKSKVNSRFFGRDQAGQSCSRFRRCDSTQSTRSPTPIFS